MINTAKDAIDLKFVWILTYWRKKMATTMFCDELHTLDPDLSLRELTELNGHGEVAGQLVGTVILGLPQNGQFFGIRYHVWGYDPRA